MLNLVFHTLHVPGADPERDAIIRIQRNWLNACVHEDPQRRGVMWNWLKELRCSVQNDADADWVVMLQDDALPLVGWDVHLQAALANSPEDVVGLTHFGSYGQKAVDKGKAYATGRYLMWGGAMAVRGSQVKDLAHFAHAFVAATDYPHDDVLLALYQAWRGESIALTSRAIFGQPIKASLLGHNTPIREPKATIENSPSIEEIPYTPDSTFGVSRGNRAELDGLLMQAKQVFRSGA